MKILYIDCRTGASGDMLAAALLEIVKDKESILKRLNDIGLEGVKVSSLDAKRSGLACNSFKVEVKGVVEDHDGHHHHHHHDDSHHHASLEEIFNIINSLRVSDRVKERVKDVYKLLADAESKAHGTEVVDVHFHEVGALDAIMDITSVMMLLEEIAPDKILSSPPEVGGGFVKASHGILPVPAPATLNLLEGVSFTSGAADSELLTPTGAAILRSVVGEFCSMPKAKLISTGVGCGTRELPDRPNVLRVFECETEDCSDSEAITANGEITELKANIDDMTGEDIAWACEKLRQLGALDVCLVPVIMKKGRPGQILQVICRRSEAGFFATKILQETSTFGVRRYDGVRYELNRDISIAPGGIRVKKGFGYGVKKSKEEFEDRKDCQIER